MKMNKLSLIKGAALALALGSVARAADNPVVPDTGAVERVKPVVADRIESLPPGAIRLNGFIQERVQQQAEYLFDEKSLSEMVEKFRKQPHRMVKGRAVGLAEGEFWGKAVRALCHYYQYSGDARLLQLLEKTVAEMINLQTPDGCISDTVPELQPYHSDMWDRKYTLLGLVNAFETTGDPKMRESAIKMADHTLTQVGPPPKVRIVDTSFKSTPRAPGGLLQGLESSSILEPVVRLYRLTGKAGYLEFAKYIVETEGCSKRGSIFEAILAGQDAQELGGRKAHTYSVISCFEGVVEYYRATGNERWKQAALAFYTNVLAKETAVIGTSCGLGPLKVPCFPEQFNHSALYQTCPVCEGLEACSAPRDRWMEEEAMRILRAYGNHPSFCLFTFGNEFWGKMTALEPMVDRLIKADPRRLYAGYTGIADKDPLRNDQFRECGVRSLGSSPSTLTDFREDVNRMPYPVISHEVCQAMVFPNMAEIPKYTGVLKPRNFELIRDDLDRKGLLEQADAFVEATGKLSALQYKGAIEEELRTPGLGGFALLGLQDVPGQGTSTVGMLDSFWDSKRLITPEAWRGFCSETVPLLRFGKRVFTTEETFTATAEVANYGPRDLTGIEPIWSVCDRQGHAVASGRFAALTLPTGHLTPLGKLEFPLGTMAAPATLTVSVALPGTPYVNRWAIHVYPATAAPAPPADVVILREWGAEAKAALAAGKKVFLQIRPELYENAFRGQFRVPLWSPLWWGNTASETMGGLFDAAHPAFAQFPTERYRDFRWEDLTGYSIALSLDVTPKDYKPIAQVVDNFEMNRKIGTLFEARVGSGRLLACGFNVWDNLAARPAARQLLRSLYAYMGSEAFAPKDRLYEATLDQVFRRLVEGTSGRLGVRIARIDGEAPGFPAANLLDGNSKTTWRTPTVAGAPVYPKELVLDVPKVISLRGCKLVQALAGGGRVRGYAIYVRGENTDWIVAAHGEFKQDELSRTEIFDPPRDARAVKVVLLNGFPWRSDSYVELAEIELLPAQE